VRSAAPTNSVSGRSNFAGESFARWSNVSSSTDPHALEGGDTHPIHEEMRRGVDACHRDCLPTLSHGWLAVGRTCPIAAHVAHVWLRRNVLRETFFMELGTELHKTVLRCADVRGVRKTS
jgi:hypothetical protein